MGSSKDSKNVKLEEEYRIKARRYIEERPSRPMARMKHPSSYTSDDRLRMRHSSSYTSKTIIEQPLRRRDRSTSKSRKYTSAKNDDDNGKEKSTNSNHSLNSISTFMSWLFLPEGYPHSVSDDYLEYQIWDTIQGFLGYIKSMLLTLCFLRGLGVGAEGNLESAMLVWIVRDTAGVISGLLTGFPIFTKRFSDKKELKKWRLVSEFIRFLGGCLEIYASAYSRSYFMFLSALVVVMNTIAGVISGQTRNALVTHFAIKDNIADCAAKEGNQDRGVKVFGIPLALYCLLQLREDIIVYLWNYLILALFQFYSTYLAMKALKI